ncbi:uncharacterized protein LOC116001455 [Ipomoea triloba]|uniref:uncharacterized protein LOC116001455 n=1 Tax=Ipomoea triloba TaxID=35885 RepID=UPI00125DC8FE|nr:uncharacterized protein LOC116001455 [Ipomoea triloba]
MLLRYKVTIRVSDATGNAAFQLWDCECNDLFGKSASELKKSYVEDEMDSFPPEMNVVVHQTLLFKVQYSTDPIKAIVESTYPSFSSIIDDPSYLQKRAILAPTLDVVHSVNEYMSSLNTSDGITYLSCDSTCKSDSNVDMLADVHSPEFLNGINCSGVPNHALTLKVGTPVMLLRNIDHSIGLCNGTRMVITKLGNHVLEARILSGTSAGLFLKKPVFSHGQLYVAVSRVTTPEGLKILICDSESTRKTLTANIVYKEVFQNL